MKIQSTSTNKNRVGRILALTATLALTVTLMDCNKKEPVPANPPPAAGEPKAASPAGSIGVGPVTQLELGALDAAMAAKGKKIFETTCFVCHKLDVKLVGPPLQGVTQRQRPEWIMNMMLNTAEMLKQDPTAMELLKTYLVPMAIPTPLSKDDARAVLEYLRQVDGAK